MQMDYPLSKAEMRLLSLCCNGTDNNLLISQRDGTYVENDQHLICYQTMQYEIKKKKKMSKYELIAS